MSVRYSQRWIVLILGVLVVALILGGCAPSAVAAPNATGSSTPAPAGESPARTITVVGSGEVKAKPDIATVNLGVEVLAPTVDAATKEASARMNTILTALKALGIADKDIQTSNFSISFERQAPTAPAASEQAPSAKPGGVEPPAGFYRVSNMVQVTVRDLEMVGDVLDAAVKAGANNVWGVSFGLDNTDTLEAEARAKAVEDAQTRAESLAKLNNVAVGDVIAISEVIGSVPVPMFAAAAAKGLGGGGTPVEPGELTFSTQVQIVYGIR